MPLIKVPFAQSGDKADVPLTDAAGGVNFTQGYPAAYSKDPATDPSAKRIERELFNGLMNAVTSAINEIQTNGVKPFITSAENGGSAFVYGAGVPVLFNGALYVSKVTANTTEPTDATKWSKIPYLTVDADGAIHSKTPAVADNTDKAATTEWLRSMVVGTCGALTGGKITGAIIERGINANGEYVKWADGTMICRIIYAHQVSGDGKQTVQHPAVFASLPTTSVQVRGFASGTNTAHFTAEVDSNQLGSVTAKLMIAQATSINYIASPVTSMVIAAGLWY